MTDQPRPVRHLPPRRRMMARPAHTHGAPRDQRAAHSKRRAGGSPRWPVGVAVVGLSLLALIGVGAFSAVGAPPSPSPTIRPSPSPATAQPSPMATLRPARTPTTSPSPTPSASPTRSPSPSPTRHPDSAPRTAAEFDLAAQVIAIGFPMKDSTRYRYRDNWAEPRPGTAEHYNHAHSRQGDELQRAHDGIDIYARRGDPVLAPFDGVVVDPGALWQPWVGERYGLTAVIVSEEELTSAYIALLSHLDRLWVEPGQRVRRGEVIGTVGSTGNAEGGPPHLHFELRAPFLLPWQELGEERLIDAFNPYPSLVAADPRRSD